MCDPRATQRSTAALVRRGWKTCLIHNRAGSLVRTCRGHVRGGESTGRDTTQAHPEETHSPGQHAERDVFSLPAHCLALWTEVSALPSLMPSMCMWILTGKDAGVCPIDKCTSNHSSLPAVARPSTMSIHLSHLTAQQLAETSRVKLVARACTARQGTAEGRGKALPQDICFSPNRTISAPRRVQRRIPDMQKGGVAAVLHHPGGVACA